MKYNVAIISHDKLKPKMVDFVKVNLEWFKKQRIYATGTTGRIISDETGLDINLKKSGPLGGDQEIGSMIANGDLDLVIFFRDPLTAQPHEPDVSALLRLCDVYEIPLATNIETAIHLIKGFN